VLMVSRMFSNKTVCHGEFVGSLAICLQIELCGSWNLFGCLLLVVGLKIYNFKLSTSVSMLIQRCGDDWVVREELA
jgi:hypothetical protein